MKKILQILNSLEALATDIIFKVGLCIILIFAVIGLSYIRGNLVMVDGRVSPNITALVTGAIAYVWLGLLAIWVLTKGLRWLLKIRNWWVHTEQHKVELREVFAALRR